MVSTNSYNSNRKYLQFTAEKKERKYYKCMTFYNEY